MNGGFVGAYDFVGSIAGFILTLMIFSYLFGDNDLFRLASHILVGVSAGFVVVVAWYNVIWPQLLLLLWSGDTTERGLLVIPFVMSFMLIAKASPRFSILGTPVMAYLVGVGAATAVGGAVLGTLIPQIQGLINQVDWRANALNAGPDLVLFMNGIIFLIGAVTTLIYFQFSAKSRGNFSAQRSPWIEWIAQIGQVFITITLGVLFAGVYLAALAALVERWSFIYNFLSSLVLS